MSALSRLGTRAAFTAIVGLSALSATPRAIAQPATSEADTSGGSARDEARAAFAEGQAAYAAGDYAAAEAHFAKADALVPSVQAKYWRAMSLDRMGKTANALELFNALLATPAHEDLGPERVAQVRQRVAELSQAPADFTLTTSPPGATVDVNGMKQQSTTPLVLRLAAGRHRVTVEAPGYAPQVLELDVAPGERVERNVVLAPTTAAVPALPPESQPPPAVAVPTERSRAPAYVTLGIAGASAVVGTIFGIRALSDKSDFDDRPTSGRADSVERNALIADMAFGVALTLGITGVVLLVADDGPSDVAHEPSERLQAGQLRVAPYITPNGAGAGASLSF